MASHSSPYPALILSLFLPGAGQIYNKEHKKGMVILGSCAGLGLFIYELPGLNKISIALALLLLWTSAVVDAYETAKASGQPIQFYYRRPYVVTMLLLVGPLALPLLWRSPHFSRLACWTWTVIVVAAALLFIATPYVMNWLIQQWPAA
jgi:hypothetical protein